MWKTLALSLAGLAGSLNALATAPAPDPRDIPVRTVRGKLIQEMIPDLPSARPPRDPEPILPPDRFPMPPLRFKLAYKLQSGAKTYTLDLGEARSLWRQARLLAGTPVLVRGVVSGDTINVLAIQADEMTLTAKLVRRTNVLRDTRMPPFTPEFSWFLRTADGKQQALVLGDKLEKQALRLLRSGDTVRVTGRMTPGGLAVTGLKSDHATGLVPDYAR
jgi:hypothetical protein